MPWYPMLKQSMIRTPFYCKQAMNETLCCHRHGIYSIGEEDFYRDPRVVMEIEEVGEEIQKLHQDFDELNAALAAIF